LGRSYFGGVGATRDLESADRWLREAAGAGDPFGQQLLGLLKETRGDYKGAAESFQKAAEQGLPQSQKHLGLLLKQGRGMPVDKADAYTWLLLSFQAGDHSTADDLKQLEGDLGSNQVEQLKTRARDRETSLARSIIAHGCTGWTGEFAELPATPPPDLQRFCR
jgi:TPR repeat protein